MLLKVIHALVVVISCGYAAVGVSGCQKGDNFLVMDRVFLGSF